MARSTIILATILLLLLNDVACWRRRRRSPPPPPRINGGWSGWGAFSACSKTCGGGVRNQYRHCNNPPPANGGSNCGGSNVNIQGCNTHACPRNGGWSGWGAFSACSKTCGGGVRNQYRHCNNPPPANGGSYCGGSNVNIQRCNTQACPPVINGGWSSWGAPSSCSKSCGRGMTHRQRTCTNPAPANGGLPCDGAASMATACNQHGCPDLPNSEHIEAPDGTKYQMVGCYNNFVHRLQEMLITERDHTSHVWNGEWIDWNNWDIYMASFIHRCAMKTNSKGYRVFGMSYYGECWGDIAVNNAVETFTADLKNPSKCVKEGYRDCAPGDMRCIGKHYGIAVYQIMDK